MCRKWATSFVFFDFKFTMKNGPNADKLNEIQSRVCTQS